MARGNTARCRVVVSCLLALPLTAFTPPRVRHFAWVGVVLGREGSSIRGDVEMYGGKTKISTYIGIENRRDRSGAVRPWQVRLGSCETSGPTFGDASAYPPLRVGRDGKAISRATIAIVLPDSGEYHVTVYESPRSPSRIVACGDLIVDE